MLLKRARSGELIYFCQGCIERGDTPRGFDRDSARCYLGSGQLAWDAAVDSFNQWQFMPASVVEVVKPDAIAPGEVVGVLFRGLGVWAFNPARIIEIHDSSEQSKRAFGFTYGTVVGHVEQGEERFLLEWDLATDEVWYRLDAVSRPKHFLAWVAYGYARRMQAKFRHESCASMLEATEKYIARTATFHKLESL